MKKLLKTLLILAFLLILTFLILIPQLLKRNPSMLDIKKYQKEDLDKKCGVVLRLSEEELGNKSCTKLWNNRNIETKYDELTFYLFNSKSKAKKAFRSIKKESFNEIIAEGDDFIKIESNDLDAYSIEYYYLTKNVIIKTCLYSAFDIAINPDTMIEGEDYGVYDPDDEELISLIRENF